MKKKFLLTWDRDLYDEIKPIIKSFKFFKNKRGYNDFDRGIIDGLEVGQWMFTEDIAPTHLIVRIK